MTWLCNSDTVESYTAGEAVQSVITHVGVDKSTKQNVQGKKQVTKDDVCMVTVLF